MKFIFACGGTAGHINPALSVAAGLCARVPDSKILFIGAGRELENRLVPRAGYEIVNIEMSGLRRGFSPEGFAHNLKTLKNLAAANTKASSIIGEFCPDAVVGTGGYICYPVLRTAAKAGIPTFIHESNAVPGLTTKLLSTIVDKVLVAFPGIENQYRKPDRVVFTGTPVREGFAACLEAQSKQEKDRKPLAVSFWGSLGAERMNEMMAEFISLNARGGYFDHIHATGKNGSLEVMRKRLQQLGVPEELPPGIEIREYIDDMQAVMSSADIILCRAGGSTIAELTAIGKPAVLVPSPYVTNDQQVKNAKKVREGGGAVMILEENCSGRELFDTVLSILRDRDKLENMSAAQKALGAPDASDRIAGIIMSYCGN